MRSHSRELNPFNMSMLDVIAGAMGAFLIIMVVLLPYYQRDYIDYRQENEKLRERLLALQADLDAQRRSAEAARLAQERAVAELNRQLDTARAEADRQLGRAETAEAALAKTFLVVYIRWNTKKQDVDLHLVNPNGFEFSFQRKVIPGQPGELSEDSQFGPGNEVWEIGTAPAGKYLLYANLYNEHGNRADPVVRGKVFFRDGSTKLPSVKLTIPRRKVPIASIQVRTDGSVTVRPL